MITITVAITAKGRLPLSKIVRAHLGVRPGDEVVVELLPDGRANLRAAPKAE